MKIVGISSTISSGYCHFRGLTKTANCRQSVLNYQGGPVSLRFSYGLGAPAANPAVPVFGSDSSSGEQLFQYSYDRNTVPVAV